VTYVVIIVLIAFAFDFINGFHDSANSIATIVGTRVLNPFAAVVWAAFFNFSAAFVVGTAVAKTVQTGMIDQSIVDPSVILAALIGAIGWNLITWGYGLPSSSSHALIGGYAGAAVTKAGWSAILWGDKWIKTLEFIVLSPLIGLAAGFTLMVAVYWAFRRVVPARVDRTFRFILARRERRTEDDGYHRWSARCVAYTGAFQGQGRVARPLLPCRSDGRRALLGRNRRV
jgi:PiT family inorganic phosphate transporter